MKKFYKTPGQVCEGTMLCPSSATPALKNGKTERADQSRPLDAGSNACVRPSRSSQFLCCLCILLLASVGCAIQPRGPVVKHIITTRSPDGTYTREEWIDDAFGRGYFILTDPALAKVAIWHTNMPALGGCSHFTAGQAGITVDSNAAPIISAGGTAIGNVIGAAAKSAVK